MIDCNIKLRLGLYIKTMTEFVILYNIEYAIECSPVLFADIAFVVSIYQPMIDDKCIFLDNLPKKYHKH